MRILKQEDVEKILSNHKHWLAHDCNGWENMRADLSNAFLCHSITPDNVFENIDLSSVNLRSADLSGSILNYVNLSEADLRDADLSGVSLIHADLSKANLSGAILYNTDLRESILENADLREAYLDSANLKNADLSEANLKGAILNSANLKNADLSEANLKGAILNNANLNNAILIRANLTDVDLRKSNLTGADLRFVKNMPFIPFACPAEGSFIGYKKVSGGKFVKLEILSDAKRSSAEGRKCRCSKAKVLGIYDHSHQLLDVKQASSLYDSKFIYEVGKIVEVKNFYENRWVECAPGIHFFMSFEEAVEYKL